MKWQSSVRRTSARASALGCVLAGALALTACGDDSSVTVTFDAGGTPPDSLDAGGTAPDATTDSGPSGGDAAPDSASDAGSATDGGDAGVVDAGVTPDGGITCTGTPSANLIVNGDAESGTGSTDATPVTTPGWTSAGEATALEYGSGGYPALTDPGPTDRGVNLFIGGYMDAMSSLTQTIDLSADAAQIDASAVTYALSGWLGGYAGQEDYATLTVTFQDGTGTALGTGTIGPVTAEDRSDVTGLLARSTTGSVPAGTRSALVVLAMVREEGTANDGYADDLSLTLCGL
jgi:hypothetical protein